MKGTGAIFISRACALLAAAMAVLPCTSGCLKVIGLEDRKEPIPLRDGGEDATDWLDVDADTADGEDELFDHDMDGDGVDVLADDDAADTEDFPDVPVDPDTEDRTDIEDIPPELDAPDVAELPPGLVWASIPSGSFEMGCSPGDEDCYDDEEPRHTVNVSAFRMTETEITQSQYEWVTGDTPSNFTGCPDCPVESVDWHEAKAFCEAIGGRLPSEAEWEYAARAGTTTRYYCGDDAACLDGIAWYSANSGSTTHPVGEKTANVFGLYDMFGNVWEWVEDCWHLDYTGAPSTGEVWSGGDCGYRVLRGGSWSSYDGNLRVSLRYWHLPDYRTWYYGFRCAR